MGKLRSYIVIVFCILFMVGLAGSARPAFADQQTHTVQPGETLFRIALQYGVTVESLVAANGLTDASRIYAGQVLTIPSGAAPAAQPAVTSPQAINTTGSTPYYYTVAPGDGLAKIARTFGITVQDLIAANSLIDPNQIQVGQKLIIPGQNASSAGAGLPGFPSVPQAAPTSAPAAAAPAVAAAPAPTGGTAYKTYTIRPGDSLAGVAQQFGVSWQTLALLNGITDPNTIYTGTVLKIPATATDPEALIAPGPVGAAAVNTTSVQGKWIKVVLHEQRVYIYEDGQLLKNVLVSTGLPATPTVIGDFKIYLKYTAQLMYGPGYYLPGVPWVMYFYRDYGLHGTYWHHNWGQPMSHGCVNMPTPEAKWLYDWAPVGTRVTVVW
jgi:LysM repeat protein